MEQEQDKSLSEQSINLIHSIAEFLHMDDETVTPAALGAVDFYRDAGREQELEWLYLWLLDGQNERALLHDFRERLSRLVE